MDYSDEYENYQMADDDLNDEYDYALEELEITNKKSSISEDHESRDLISLTKSNSVKFYTPKSLIQLQSKLISDIVDQYGIDREVAFRLLVECKWNEIKLGAVIEKYFQSDILQAASSDLDECPICLDSFSSCEKVFFPECKHPFCSNCLKDFLKNCIATGEITQTCPEQGCKSVVNPWLFQQLLSAEEKDKYEHRVP